MKVREIGRSIGGITQNAARDVQTLRITCTKLLHLAMFRGTI
jgi:hypothetical protein